MSYYKDLNNGLHFLENATYEYLLPTGCIPITNEEAAELQKPAPLTADQIIATYEAAAQSHIDALAQSWGYDSLISAASYANSSVAKFKSEAMALIAWRDATWQAAYGIEVSVKGGSTLPASTADFLALLPLAPDRPL